MKHLIYIFLVCLLMACERQPLRILPMTEGASLMVKGPFCFYIKNDTIPGRFYPQNFIDDKQCLKELLQYVKDSIPNLLPPDSLDSFCSYVMVLYKKNSGAFYDDGEIYIDQEVCFKCIYNKMDFRYFKYFGTWSEFCIWNPSSDDVEEIHAYNYKLNQIDDSFAVSFDYEEFNTDVWQKFLNIAFYERAFNDNVLNKYSLVNPTTQQIECVVTFSYINKQLVFTIDIL